MFNPDFYPTPPAITELMLTPWLGQAAYWDETRRQYRTKRAPLAGMTILEPCAGRGAILDWMVDHIKTCEGGDYGWLKSKLMYACELDPELKATLLGKNYKVIADDFLAYQGDHQFDLVVMNPPFNQGAAFVLKAWEVVAPGGHVVALVNSETVRNTYTERRLLLEKLIADHGSREELGQVFAEDAERKTDVEVSLIRLQKPVERDPLKFEFKSRTREHAPELTEDTFQSAVTVKDVVGNMMLCNSQVKQAFVDYMRALRGLEFYSKDLVGVPGDVRTMADEAIQNGGSVRAMYNSFSDSLKQCSWRAIFGKLNIEKYMTHDVHQNFQRYSAEHGYMDFTKENVLGLVDLIFANRNGILEQAVVAVFDTFTKYHADNRCYVEGWKTNDKFKVTRRVILPRWVRWDDWHRPADLKQYGSCFRTNFNSEYDDIDKVCCFLTGTNYDTCYTIERALKVRFDRLGKVYPGESFEDTCESEFFEMRFFKKGTLHLTFKEEALWQEFNLRACAGKLWLPEQDMKAYRERKHSPFAQPEPAPAPVSEEPATLLLPALREREHPHAAETAAEPLMLAATGGASASAQPGSVPVERVYKIGQQLGLFAA